MKISDMIVSALIKRGVFYEARNIDTTFIVPTKTKDDKDTTMQIQVKIDHMSLRVEKEGG